MSRCRMRQETGPLRRPQSNVCGAELLEVCSVVWGCHARFCYLCFSFTMAAELSCSVGVGFEVGWERGSVIVMVVPAPF